MFKKIYVPFDNSEHSAGALRLGLELAAMSGATLVGSHVYAAKLHEWRFRALESGLPEEFQKEQELERQREIHDSLIASGLELITDSYLTVMGLRCAEVGVPFQGVSLEGRNWQALVKDIETQGYDLVVMGALGLGRTPESLVGTVCERVARRVLADVLVVRETAPAEPCAPIVVCLDGSKRGWAGLEHGLKLAESTGRPLAAVSAFDPYFHYTLFDSLKTALTEKAKEVFKFEQQERLHEQIIDSGLAKIYQSHLDVARRLAEEVGRPMDAQLLDGKPAEKILQFARKERPWLLIVGRTGIHGGDAMDLGGVTEHLLRLAPCNLLIVGREKAAPDAYLAEATTAWTEEGAARLEQAPPQVRGVAMAGIQRFAIAEGYTMITSAVVDHALEQILPPQARIAMGITKPEARAADPPQSYLSLSYACPSCNYVHTQKRPQLCPICGARGTLFRVIAATPHAPGAVVEAVKAFDGVILSWEAAALARLEMIPDSFLRKRARHKIEKKARGLNLRGITAEFAEQSLAEGPTNAAGNGGAQSRSGGGESRTGRREPGPLSGWTEPAWKRLCRAPEGFMRERARARIEAYSRELGAKLITLEIAEAGMGKAREEMENSFDTE